MFYYTFNTCCLAFNAAKKLKKEIEDTFRAKKYLQGI